MSETHHDCCAHHGHHHELVIENLTVSYRRVLALENISMATSCGNRVALIGPNGAGKSTLLKAIAGLVPRDSGTIRWRGTAVKKWSREFAYLPQREEVDWAFPITVRGLGRDGPLPADRLVAEIFRCRHHGRGIRTGGPGPERSPAPPDPRAFRRPATARFPCSRSRPGGPRPSAGRTLHRPRPQCLPTARRPPRTTRPTKDGS